MYVDNLKVFSIGEKGKGQNFGERTLEQRGKKLAKEEGKCMFFWGEHTGIYMID